MTSEQHTVLSALTAFALLLFVRLALVDIQPDTEGKMALNGNLVAKGNTAVMDFVARPDILSVAWGIRLLGPSVYGIRTSTILASVLAVFALFQLMRGFATWNARLLFVVMIAGSVHWMWFSRLASGAVIGAMLVALAVWLLSNLRASNSRVSLLLYGTGVLLAVGTLALIAPLLVAIPFAITLFLVVSDGVHVPYIRVAVTATLIPCMVAVSEVVPIQADVGFAGPAFGSLFSVLGAFYNSSILIWIGSAFAVYVLFSFCKLNDKGQVELGVLAVWAVATLAVAPFAGPNPHVVVVCAVLPAISLAAAAVDRVRFMGDVRHIYAGLMLMFLGIVYSASVPLGFEHAHSALVVALLLVGVVGTFLLRKLLKGERKIHGTVFRIWRVAVTGLSFLMVVRMLWVVFISPVNHVEGGVQTAGFILKKDRLPYAYVHHRVAEGDTSNWQMQWYLRHWYEQEVVDVVRTVSLGPVTADPTPLLKLISAPLPVAVYYHHGIPEALQAEVENILGAVYKRVDGDYGDYTLYMR